VQLGIMSMFNIRSKSVEASTCTTIAGGASNYEIALVLDNSGSMNESVSGNSKIAAMRTAATNFVNTMFNGPFTGKVKMSIVPLPVSFRFRRTIRQTARRAGSIRRASRPGIGRRSRTILRWASPIASTFSKI
jgi:hypothetical protein